MSVARSASRFSDGRTGNGSAVRAIALRIGAVRDSLARAIAERLRAETGELDDTVVFDESVAISLGYIDAFVARLQGAEPMSEAQIERTREMAARRANQRVPLESFLHRKRVWGEVVWEAVIANTRANDPLEREAALAIASALMRQVDLIASVATSAYLDEVTDRGLVRRDLLDALVSGKSDPDTLRRQARLLHVTLAERYIVVVVRGDDMHGEVGRSEPLSARVALDHIVETARRHLQPPEGSLLVGMRQGDLVALYPCIGPADLELVRERCTDLARSLPVDVSLGMSACHRGLPALAVAYAEARDAADVADRLGIRGHAVELEDVLVDHMVRSSAHARRILEATMRALVDYDREHGTELVATLKAYADARFNVTQSARTLLVHPNTMVYRLRRVLELTGRDPRDADDLLVLLLGLRVLDLRQGQSPDDAQPT